MIRAALAGWLALSLGAPMLATAQTAGLGADSPGAEKPGLDAAVLERPDAFERGFAVSLYLFDACGDPLAGRMFRRALAERFAQCPFSPGARSRYQQRTRIQQTKVQTAMQGIIEDRGGLPMQLDGMSMTCREQQGSDGYRQLRTRLEQYAQGGLPAQAIIAARCDAPEITP